MYKVLVGEYIDDEAIAGLLKSEDVEVDVKVGISREEILNIIYEYDALIVLTRNCWIRQKNLKL